jgi:hypothetical protein
LRCVDSAYACLPPDGADIEAIKDARACEGYSVAIDHFIGAPAQDRSVRLL